MKMTALTERLEQIALRQCQCRRPRGIHHQAKEDVKRNRRFFPLRQERSTKLPEAARKQLSFVFFVDRFLLGHESLQNKASL
jgi:hypothetical protein